MSFGVPGGKLQGGRLLGALEVSGPLIRKEVAPSHTHQRGFQSFAVSLDFFDSAKHETNVIGSSCFGLIGVSCKHGLTDRDVLHEKLLAHPGAQVKVLTIEKDVVAKKLA